MNTLKRKATSALDTDDTKKTRPNASIMSFFNPKTPGATPSGAAPTASSPAFNKDKWVASLTQEQRDLLRLEIETLHVSWLAMLKDDVVSEDFLNLKRFLNREAAAGQKIFPPREDIYSWSRYTPFNTIKVVIIGQDPYHNINQAHGLAFSVRPPTPTPPSLRNMYVCLTNDYPDFVTPPKNNGLLTPWAERGVLLLNTCLTVRAHEANSHANRGWERFTQRVIDLVAAKRSRGVVFMAWGTPAGKRVVKVDQKRHLVLKAVHPSPLSASRGYFTCGHFRKANEWLVTRYGENGEVDWNLVPRAAPEKIAPPPPPAVKVTAEATTPKQKVEKQEEREEEEADGEVTPKASAVVKVEEKVMKKEKKDEEKEGEKKEDDVAEEKPKEKEAVSEEQESSDPVIHEDVEQEEKVVKAAEKEVKDTEPTVASKVVDEDEKENQQQKPEEEVEATP